MKSNHANRKGYLIARDVTSRLLRKYKLDYLGFFLRLRVLPPEINDDVRKVVESLKQVALDMKQVSNVESRSEIRIRLLSILVPWLRGGFQEYSVRTTVSMTFEAVLTIRFHDRKPVAVYETSIKAECKAKSTAKRYIFMHVCTVQEIYPEAGSPENVNIWWYRTRVMMTRTLHKHLLCKRVRLHRLLTGFLLEWNVNSLNSCYERPRNVLDPVNPYIWKT